MNITMATLSYGPNKQRQAIPLDKAEAPIVGTGVEERAARDSGHVAIA
jgi:DNA-directed RNA polymerase subunit beta